MADQLESLVLRTLQETGDIADSGIFAKEIGVNDHNELVGVLKSLEAHAMIDLEEIPNQSYNLTDEGKKYVDEGATPEAQVFRLVANGPVSLADLKKSLGAVGDIGFKQAMQQKWVAIDKSSGQPMIDPSHVQSISKRKLVILKKWITFSVKKGPKFALERKKQVTDLTGDMVQKGTWKDEEFKEYNFDALGLLPEGGYLHPLLKVRTRSLGKFLQVWPQQHPARDAHDTFFLTRPSHASLEKIPQDYLQRVKDTHENGGYGSIGYGYSWSFEEAQKNLLRTHTTAVSSRMLYKLAQDGFKPAKYFSIDRVFRNESIDRTHLAEFHQVEGVVCGYGLNLGNLIGVLKEFFERLGLGSKLRFKPAFNPYTEPSMEIFSYSEELGKWMEVGNSGMFRPEMLRPMGIPKASMSLPGDFPWKDPP
eukprot:jgi/Picre1/33878/NNA_001357.t1